MSRSACLALALVACLTPLASADTIVILDASGTLLLGTTLFGVGSSGELPPVSYAMHRVAWSDVPRELLVAFSYASTVEPLAEPERALMIVELHTLGGQLVDSWLATHGSLFASTELLPPGEYRLRVHLFLGGPVEYRALVEGHAVG